CQRSRYTRSSLAGTRPPSATSLGTRPPRAPPDTRPPTAPPRWSS
ncbi:MAG: hypothetical protein AVDCRST_MAG06-102, partial [uncultured Nocardioides sp.]